MWRVRDAVQLGRTGEVLVNLRNAPADTDEVVRMLEEVFTFETLEFVTDTDDQGVTTEWAVLGEAKVRSRSVDHTLRSLVAMAAVSGTLFEVVHNLIGLMLNGVTA